MNIEAVLQEAAEDFFFFPPGSHYIGLGVFLHNMLAIVEKFAAAFCKSLSIAQLHSFLSHHAALGIRRPDLQKHSLFMKR